MNDPFAVAVLTEMRDQRRRWLRDIPHYFTEKYIRQLRREIPALTAAINRLTGKK